MDRVEALNKIGADYEVNTPSGKLVHDALNDPFWNIRNKAISCVNELARSGSTKEETKTKLLQLAEKDEKADVRASALKAIAKYYEGEDIKALLIRAADDSSYDVMSTALNELARKDKSKAMELAKRMEDATSSHAINAIASIYADNGTEEQNAFFLKAFDRIKGIEKYALIQSYGVFLGHCENPVFKQGADKLLDLAEHTEPWYMRSAAMNAAASVSAVLSNRVSALQRKIAEDKKNPAAASSISASETKLAELQQQDKQMKEAMKTIKSNEKDKNLVKMYKLTGN